MNFWSSALVQITGVVLFTQVVFEVTGIMVRKPGFEWVIIACAAAFIASLIYAGIDYIRSIKVK